MNKDISRLKEEIKDYLETEGTIMPSSYIEEYELDNLNEEKIKNLAKQLGID